MVAILLCICACYTVTFSAPVAEYVAPETDYMDFDKNQIDYMREKRLNDNNLYAISPCAAAAAAAASAQYPTLQSAPARYDSGTNDYTYTRYAGDVYKFEDPYRDGKELLSFSNTNYMEPATAARFTYRTVPNTYLPINSVNLASINGHNSAPLGSVYGVFPSSNAKGCSVPLLFSCTPSVIKGQMIKADTQEYAHPASAFNPYPGPLGVEQSYIKRAQANKENAENENLSPVNKPQLN